MKVIEEMFVIGSFIFCSMLGSVTIVDNSVLKSWNFSADLATPFAVFDSSISQKRRPSWFMNVL